jgi:8-oxo-dGTP pyrophosphatase MutT (NUDIX family)
MKHKVLAYVTRWPEGRMQVLVFDHRDYPEAGTQVPAGTVEPGEPPEQAVLREVEEESGLRPGQLRLMGKLAEHEDPTSGAHRHFYHLQAADGLPESWAYTVRSQGEDDGMVFIYRWAGLDIELAGGQHRYLSVITEI